MVKPIVQKDPHDSEWGKAKLGKLWVYTKDLLENGKRPLLPAQSFYSDWHGSTKDLAIMAGKIMRYLRFSSPWVLRVNFTSEIDAPGLFMLSEGKARIDIHSKYRDNATACAAILAHEITHLVLNIRSCREDNNLENERFTDFATVYFGLGVLVLNGKYSSHTTDSFSVLKSLIGFLAFIFAGIGFFSNPFRKVENSFGYWSVDDYYMIFLGYVLRNNLDLDTIAQYIKKGTKYPCL